MLSLLQYVFPDSLEKADKMRENVTLEEENVRTHSVAKLSDIYFPHYLSDFFLSSIFAICFQKYLLCSWASGYGP